MALQMPEEHFMAVVKVGDKGQIVIPKGARELFNIQPGDVLTPYLWWCLGYAVVRLVAAIWAFQKKMRV